MPQPQQRQFPGYGVVYPGGGTTGIKVIHTFTDAPKKVINPDGSVSYGSPFPTIHELHGGGFCYADGNLVTRREHLEAITESKMRERALQWYETHGKAISPSDIVVKEDETERPAPDYILSNQLPTVEDEVTKGLNEQMENSLASIAESISSLATLVKKQGEEIAQMKAVPPIPSKIRKRGLQSQSMKDRWADPAFREKMKHRGKGGKEEGKVKEEV